MFNLDISNSFDITLIALTFAFWVLFVYSILRLITRCCQYGCQRGIVSALTATYLITVLLKGCLLLLIIFHEIKVYEPSHQHDILQSCIRILGSYVSLFLNVLIDCLIFCCWISLFADLLLASNPQSSMHKALVRIRLIHCAICFIILYLLIIITSSILNEIYSISLLSLPILSYIHCFPISINLHISLLSLCKLPIAQVWSHFIHKIYCSFLISQFVTLSLYTATRSVNRSVPTQYDLFLFHQSQSVYLVHRCDFPLTNPLCFVLILFL